MDAREALTCSDEALREHINTLTDEQFVDFLAAVDAAELVHKGKPIDLGVSAAYIASKWDWPVFPVVPRGKRPLTKHGFKDATVDPARIRAWWAQWPDANIATPTGHDGCGYDVIDVDGRVGIASLADLKHAHCPEDCSAERFCDALGELPPVTARAITPGSTDGPGFHYYVAPTGDGNSTNLAPGIDYRGDGGFVVVPPSLGLNGHRYTWITRPPLAPAGAA